MIFTSDVEEIFMSMPLLKKDFQNGKISYYNRNLSIPQGTITVQGWDLIGTSHYLLGEDIKTWVTNMRHIITHGKKEKVE